MKRDFIIWFKLKDDQVDAVVADTPPAVAIPDDKALDSDEELERELERIRADTAKNQERREQMSPLSEPGDAEYDYVSKVCRFNQS